MDWINFNDRPNIKKKLSHEVLKNINKETAHENSVLTKVILACAQTLFKLDIIPCLSAGWVLIPLENLNMLEASITFFV